MSHPSPSASIVSLVTTISGDTSTPTQSTTNLIPQSVRGDLVTATSSSAPSSSKTTPIASVKPQASPVKDYESAFAVLSSSYGWGGAGVPTKTTKGKKDKDNAGAKDKKDKKKKKKGTESPHPSTVIDPSGKPSSPTTTDARPT